MLSTIFSLTRPAAPTITGVNFDQSTGLLTVDCTPVADASEYHVVLLTDLSVGLEAAYATGNIQKTDGTVISYSNASSSLKIPVGDQFRERYFVAVAASKSITDTDSVKVFSPWKLFTSAAGVPRAVTTGYGTSPENVLYRARKVDKSNDSIVVVDISFSLPTTQLPTSKLTLYHNSTKALDLTIGSIPAANLKTTIKDAIENPSGIDSTLFIRRDTLGFSLFSIYHITKMAPSDSISVEIIKPDGTVLDTANRKIFIIEDAAHRDIIKTITTLCRMSTGTPDPVYPGVLENPADSSKVKLLTTAMLDLAVAHNSPLGEKNEEQQGIFTNYLQFFDDVVRNWGSVGTSVPGMPRLQAIFGRVLTVNKGAIVDSLSVINHGTLSDYGMPAAKRKNYAFYEGYSRLFHEMDRPAYTAGVKVGTGVMFRVSKNIEVYTANMADTFNMFKEPFLTGGSTDSSRIIFRANDTLIDSMNTNGIWVKGKNREEGEKIWYCGMTPVRLPIQVLPAPLIPVRNMFSIVNEAAGKGDPSGTLVGGMGKSLLRCKVLYTNDNNTVDTVISMYDSVLLHGEQRWLEFDTNYVKGNLIKFICRAEDTSIITLVPSGYGVKVIDKAHDEAVIRGSVEKNIDNKNVPTIVIETKTNAGTLLLKNAVNRKAEVVFEGSETGITGTCQYK